MGSSALPLQGVRVLDLSRLLPGPYATLVLADLGAQVDKVEEPDGGDSLRAMPPFFENGSALFEVLNRNKRSVALNLKEALGRNAFLRLVPHYDILVESFRPGVMARLGLDFSTLQALHPRLIQCSISGYGQTGPDAQRAGHDLNYLARAGFLGACGPAGAPPPLPGGQIADVGGGSLFSLVGILAALYERERTGQGRHLDVSMTEGVLAFLHMSLGARMLLRGEAAPAARGTEALNGGYACYGVYRTLDGKYLAVAALEPKFFSKLCARLGRPELVAQGYDIQGGGAAVARAELETIFASRSQADWVAFLSADDVCVEPVHEGDALFQDRQLVARGVFGAGALKTPLPFESVLMTRAPKLGEHTQEVFREAGLSEAEWGTLIPRPA